MDVAYKNDGVSMVGHEIPVSLGIVEKLMEKNLKIFGATQNAAK